MPRPPRKKYLAQLEAVAAERASQAEEGGGLATSESPSRARMPGPDSTTEERVLYIAGEMSEGRWDGYLSRRPLAAAWSRSEETIKGYSAEAHRLIAYDPQEREEKRRSLAAFVAAQRERASNMTSFVTGLPDFGAALKAVELEAKCLGIELDPAKKFELTGKDGGPIQTADVTPTEARRLIAESFGERVVAPSIASETADPSPDDEGPGEGSPA